MRAFSEIKNKAVVNGAIIAILLFVQLIACDCVVISVAINVLSAKALSNDVRVQTACMYRVLSCKRNYKNKTICKYSTSARKSKNFYEIILQKKRGSCICA